MAQRKPIPRGFDMDAAVNHLARRDRALGRWIARIGPLEFEWHKPFDPVDALARSIIFQQLSGKAAATIEARLRAAIPGGPKLKPEALLAMDPVAMRACGVSANKQRALKDLAAKALDGVVPSTRQLGHLDDDELITRLTAVHGIGRWTVEMMLMFRLGRPDLLPVDDLAVRKGASRLAKRKTDFTARELREHGARWAPYRSAASFYLWRIYTATLTPRAALATTSG